MPVVLVSIVVAVTLSGPGAAAPASPNLLAVVQAYEAAANTHDWSRVDRLLAPNAVVELGDDLSLAGRDGVRALHEWERAMGTEIHYTECGVAGQTVSCRASEQNDFLRIAGLGAIEYSSSSLTFEGGRIARMSAVLSEESGQAVSRYMQGFLAWASRADPKATAVFLRPDGSFAFGYDSAMVFKRLLRAYVLTRGASSRAL
jgi:hypothetical protein